MRLAALPSGATGEDIFLLAREAFQRNELDAAARYAETVINTYPDSPWQKRALFLRGRALLGRGLTVEAEQVLLSILLEYPVLSDYALFLLAEHHAVGGRSAPAVELYSRLIDDFPSSSLVPRASLMRAQTLLEAGSASDAAAAFERTLRDYPWSSSAAEAGLGLGRARAAAGDLAGASRALLDVIVRFPGNGRDEEVDALLAAYKAQGGEIPRLTADEQYERARNLFRAARHDKAYTAFTRALEADPVHPQRADILLKSGVALFHQGRRPEAASLLERLLKAKLPDCRCAEALNWLGKSYSRLGLRDEAVESYVRLVRLFPDSEWADDALYLAGNVYRDGSDVKKALRYYRRLADEYPESSLADSALWWEAWANYSAAEYRTASAVLQELVRRYPRSFLVNQALYWQGRAAEHLGERERAAKLYRRIQGRGPYTYYGYLAEDRLNGKAAPVIPAGEGGEDPAGEAEGEPPADPEPDLHEEAFPPDWAGDVVAALSSSPAYRKTLELMHLGMKQEAAAELTLLEGLLPRRYGALMGLSKSYFELGDYHRSLVLILRNFERLLERPSPRAPGDLWRLAYPLGHWQSIVDASRKHRVDPYFVAAIIRQESSFHAGALSPAGARGIMQVMPTTGDWIARTAKREGFERSQLFDAGVNIELGAWYLDHLMKRFQGNLHLVAAAYNAGPEAVRSWTTRDGAATDPAVFVESIPYTETRGYVKKVLRNHAEYRRIYGGSGQEAGKRAEGT